MKVVDATNLIAGRMASFVVKELLKGEQIAIINAEKAVFTGNKTMVFARYKQRVDRGEPTHGPHFPKMPHMILKRVVRGMLPYKKEKGLKAMKKLKIYIGCPDELKNQKAVTYERADANKIKVPKSVTIEEISKWLGAKW